MSVLLEIDNLGVSFTSAAKKQVVVESVSLTIHAGEKLALVGESGSGKSVTAMSILRLHEQKYTEYTGNIRFAEREVLELPERELRGIRGREITMIFQEPMIALNPLHTIGQQIVEPLLLHEGLDAKTAEQRAIYLLERVGIADASQRMAAWPHQLSGGQRQRVMIAMALACRPRLLIADEPTTALDVTIQRQILDLLNELQAEFGMAVLLITHDLNMVRYFAERVCVMQKGRLVEQGEVAALFAAPQHPYTQHLMASEPDAISAAEERAAFEQQSPLLQAHDLSCVFPIKAGFFRRQVGEVRAVDKVQLQLRPGETLGIVGESGSGKSTLGLCLLRLQDCQGEIMFVDQRLDKLSQAGLRPLRRHFQMVFQDPFSSLSPRLTVEQIIGEGLGLHFPQLDKDARRARTLQVLDEVGLPADILARYPHEFSGGQRQRIAIARAIVLEPKLILFDEPTSALDVSVQKQVLSLLHELQQRHRLSYLFISHDLRVIRAVAHRVMVMHQGEVVETAPTEQLFASPQHPYTQKLLAATLM
ncbi:MAG: ABC transporter ATP-binding protein [Thiohalomonadaceae bacterium]